MNASTRLLLGFGAGAFGSGALFGAGLVVSGMTRPEKVLGFLDVFGAWDASLLFVMLGAVAVHALAHRAIRGRPSPVLATTWSVPPRRSIDWKLLGGAALFGVGWGLGGYCPGPAVVSLGGGAASAFVFGVAMLAGMLATIGVERLTQASPPPDVFSGSPAPRR